MLTSYRLRVLTFGLLSTVVLLACTLPGLGWPAALKTSQQAPTAIPTASLFVPSATPGITATVVAEPVNITNPRLLDFDLISDKIAWGVNENGLLYTSDGGKSWRPITIPNLERIGFQDRFFLNANSAWLLRTNNAAGGKLFHTNDKGVTWQTYDFPYQFANLQFFDAQFGITLAALSAGAGSEAIAIAYTVDSGQTWKEVFNNDPTSAGPKPDPKASIPLGGMKSGMYFREPAIGWVTGNRLEDGYIYLFQTKDGGVSWKQQSIPLPAGKEKAMLIVSEPKFFDQNHGILPVEFFIPDTDTQTIFYASSDGGESWTFSTPIERSQANFFFDANHGWSWDRKQLVRTTDGAKTWETATGLPEGDWGKVRIDFVSSDQGWILFQADGGMPGELYYTLDGGVHWQLASQ